MREVRQRLVHCSTNALWCSFQAAASCVEVSALVFCAVVCVSQGIAVGEWVLWGPPSVLGRCHGHHCCRGSGRPALPVTARYFWVSRRDAI